MTLHHPGTSEIGWLADLKEIAEQVGAQVLGKAIRWDVEVIRQAGSKRPDIVIRDNASGRVLASGEAKRPDTPKGLHPLVASEVKGARAKAVDLGAPVFFTTNFLQAAIFRNEPNHGGANLDGLQGGLICLVPEALATAPNWWSSLQVQERNAQVLLGIRQLFERIKLSSSENLPRQIDEVTLHVFSRFTDRVVQPLYEELRELRNSNRLPGELATHALRVDLKIHDGEQLRFLAAQGVAEVLTALLFYRNIADHFSLHGLLAGTTPRTASVFTSRLRKSFQEAMAACGDYETIFTLSPIGEFVIGAGGEPVLAHWKDLIGFVDQLDFTQVTSDVIGSIFERLISPERRHAMGQHYTNSALARSMSRWALRHNQDVIADIACGAGTFLVALYHELAAKGRAHQDILAQLLGNDKDPFAVHLATVNLATRDIYRGANYPAVRLGDAFEIRPGGELLKVTSPAINLSVHWPRAGLDAAVGNPPYVEKAEHVDSLRAHLSQLGVAIPRGMKKANLAAWFFLLAAALIKKDGVIALVMPSAVLQNRGHERWRSWLRRRFDVVIWHCEDEVWFSDARVASCVMLATERKQDGAFGTLHFVDVRERVGGLVTLVNGIPSPVTKACIRDISAIPADDDILVAGSTPDVLNLFASSDTVLPLRDLQRVSLFSGNKLGHRFFQLRDRARGKAGVLRRVEGFELELELNRQYLAPLLSSPKDERTGEFTTSAYWVLAAPQTLPASGQLQQYIEHGEQLDVPRAPSVAQRGQAWWYEDWRRTQVAVQIHPSFLHQVWWSDEPFVAKNNFHILAFAPQVAQADRELIAASLASGWGALSALYISGEVGCEGVRWLSTSQFERWPVLDPEKVTQENRASVLQAYRRFRKLRAKEIQAMDVASMDAWLTLTQEVARAAGMSDPAAAARQCLDTARQVCVRRTQRESMALAGRVRKGRRDGSNLGKHVRARLKADPSAAAAVARLTGGDRQMELRVPKDIPQSSFDFGDTSSIAGETSLARTLGDGFACAPVIVNNDLEYLARELESLLTGLIVTLVGERPAEGDSALNTYIALGAEVRSITIKWLQHEVKRKLS